MNRPQRIIKPNKRCVEEETPAPKRIKTKRTLTLDVPKVEVKDSIVEGLISKPKITKRKTKSGTQRTLHLDLSDVPPTCPKYWQKVSEVWGLDDFWFTHFYTPNDNITQLYIQATDKLKEILPAFFFIYPEYKENVGIANLEL